MGGLENDSGNEQSVATKSLTSGLDFGYYCKIEMERHGVPNEIYTFKVIGRLKSNAYVDVPVQSPSTETLHDEVVPVIRAIQCGVSEDKVLKFRVNDLEPSDAKATRG